MNNILRLSAGAAVVFAAAACAVLAASLCAAPASDAPSSGEREPAPAAPPPGRPERTVDALSVVKLRGGGRALQPDPGTAA